MSVLLKIFGDYPQVKILEVFADHFDEELSILDIIWLTDIPKTTIYNCIGKLLEEKILLEGSKVGKEKLADRLKERGLKQLGIQ